MTINQFIKIKVELIDFSKYRTTNKPAQYLANNNERECGIDVK
jgi:hypothetical protein